MSCYEWESGVIKIPVRQWRAFAEKMLSEGAGLKSSTTNDIVTFELDGDASITLDAKARAVRWTVYENNHAREHARDHKLAKTLFYALNHIDWTRGSGGEIVGNDEYNRDSCDLGEGGNYLVAGYGPQKKRRRRL